MSKNNIKNKKNKRHYKELEESIAELLAIVDDEKCGDNDNYLDDLFLLQAVVASHLETIRNIKVISFNNKKVEIDIGDLYDLGDFLEKLMIDVEKRIKEKEEIENK